MSIPSYLITKCSIMPNSQKAIPMLAVQKELESTICAVTFERSGLMMKREPDIWLMAVMDAVRSPSTRLVAQQGQSPADQDKICRCWNRGSCTLPYCQFRHVCFVCRAATK